MSNIPGGIVVTKHTDPQTDVVTFTAEWEGASTVWISHELMDEHLDPPFHRDGDDLTICQFKLRITGRLPNGDYVAERVE